METILLIKTLPFPFEIQHKIIVQHKYDCYIKRYKKQFDSLNKHLLYYSWLNNKLIKRDNMSNQTLLKTIKEYDYYIKSHSYEVE